MRATQRSSLSFASASMTGPTWVAGSRGSPTLSSRAAPATISMTRSAMSSWRQRSRSAEQRWPAERNAEAITSSVTCSGNAVASTIMALMPPVSAISGTIGPSFAASVRLIRRATSVEPVKTTPATRASAVSAAPTLPSPSTRCSAEGSTPAEPSALHLVLGDGKVGAALTADARVAGVVFTGSTEVARLINRTLAAKEGPIVPLIAETGGINAMIVDATALPEQVADDVITSAFRSAGQRCSALRLLCVQDDVADRMIEMIAGATRELVLGDPCDPATHVGPVIDDDAKLRLDRWIADKAGQGRVMFRWDDGRAPPPHGRFVPPTMIRLDRASDLQEEVFGPVLHVVRWPASGLDALLDDIAGNGTGLTLGIHTRIDAVAERIAARLIN